MADILLLQQVTRGMTFGGRSNKRQYPPEDPDSKKISKIFKIVFIVLVLILFAAVFI